MTSLYQRVLKGFIKFSIPLSLCCGVSSNPTLEMGGKGGLLKLINLPKDTPLSLRRGVSLNSRPQQTPR